MSDWDTAEPAAGGLPKGRSDVEPALGYVPACKGVIESHNRQKSGCQLAQGITVKSATELKNPLGLPSEG